MMPGVGIDRSDALVPAVSQIDMTVCSDVHRLDAVQECVGGDFAVVNTRAAQDRGDDAGGTVKAPCSTGAITPQHGAIRVCPDAALHRVATRHRPVEPLFAESGLAGADDGRDDAGGAVHAAHAEAKFLTYVHIVMGIKTERIRHEGARLNGGSTIAIGGALPVAEDGGDDAGRHVDLADAIVRVVAHVEIPLRIESDMLGMPERRLRGGAAIAMVPLETVIGATVGPTISLFVWVVTAIETGKAVDDSRFGVDASNVVRPLARQIDVTVGRHGRSACGVRLRVDCWPAVAAAAEFAAADDVVDDAGLCVNAPEHGTVLVTHVEIPLAIEAQIVRITDSSFARGTPIPRVPGDAITGERVEDSLPIDAPDALALIVVDDQVTRVGVNLGKAHDA